jgi:starvation-inducible DNA-binding protein
MASINIGLTEEQRAGVMDLLNHDLADAYLLLVKTKKYHWDVVGPQFRTLHQLWEEHYEALTENIDAIAERIRALGGYPAGTMEEFLKLASLKEHPGDIPLATQMSKLFATCVTMLINAVRNFTTKALQTFSPD